MVRAGLFLVYIRNLADVTAASHSSTMSHYNSAFVTASLSEQIYCVQFKQYSAIAKKGLKIARQKRELKVFSSATIIKFKCTLCRSTTIVVESVQLRCNCSCTVKVKNYNGKKRVENVQHCSIVVESAQPRCNCRCTSLSPTR